MDSTRDDAADELLELTGAVRRQLARHVSLGAWAAPGTATTGYTGSLDEQAEAAEPAVAPAELAAPASATVETASTTTAVPAIADRASVAAERAAGPAIDRAPVVAERAAGPAMDRAPVAADRATGRPLDCAPVAVERAAGPAIDRAPVAERATGRASADVRRAGGSATDATGFEDEADAMAAAAAMDDARFEDDRTSAFSFEAATTAPRSQGARAATAAAPRSQAARAAAAPRIEVAPAPAQAPLIVDEASLVSLGRRTLAQIREELGDCKRCKLHSTRRNIVFGVGAEDAPMMFIGEAPGEQEDKRGEPFVGPAGELLDKMIDAMGWSRQTVYIANILKSRPPGNRNPQPDEVAACSPFLDAQIRAIAPRIIVTLGRPAANHVLGRDAPISALRGKFHDRAGVRVMPTFHPAYLLREPAKKRDTWSDLKQVMAELERLGIRAPNPPRE